MEKEIRDVVIIGGGPAGMAAGLYASRALLDTVIVESKGPGGQMAQTHEIENYPGFVQPVAGAELVQAMLDQAKRFGLSVETGTVEQLDLSGDIKTVHTSSGVVKAKALILATGVEPKRLGVPGEQEYTGRGVSYCATCDGAFFRGKKVAVVGGGDTAVKEALFLTRFAREVVLIHRRDQLRSEHIQRQRLLNSKTISPRWFHVVHEIKGDGKRVDGVIVENIQSGSISPLALDGVFVFIGRTPVGPLADSGLELDKEGFVITDESMATNIPGVFAAGDVRSKKWRQIVTATAEGSVAALEAAEYIENYKE